jgi:hypothetical protein
MKASLRYFPLALVAALALGVGAATPAQAAPESGVSLVIATDAAAGTVTLEGGRVFRVTPSTRILGPHGRLLQLSQLPVAQKTGPLSLISPEATVRYEAEVTGARRVLRTIEVGAAPAH